MGFVEVVIVVVVVVTVGVTGQVVRVVVQSFRLMRPPGERRRTHVRLINSTSTMAGLA